jgi:regulator of PEP synthase PpsR (kinase-PPPase family)
MTKEKGHHVFIVSDATGETADRMVRAALFQFQDEDITVTRFSDIRSVRHIKSIVSDAAKKHAFIVHTIVSERLREKIFAEGKAHKVQTVDLIGSLLYTLAKYLKKPPVAIPGILHQLDEEYFNRIEAIEFTVKHDDGREVHDLDKADIVLVGVSRTSKTPLSVFLAHKGWKVANIPIALGVEPPQELYKIDQRKIVGMTIDPERLTRIREARLKNIKEGLRSSYADITNIKEELKYAHEIFGRNHRWPILDVTGKSVEDTAKEVLGLVVTKRE